MGEFRGDDSGWVAGFGYCRGVGCSEIMKKKCWPGAMVVDVSGDQET